MTVSLICLLKKMKAKIRVQRCIQFGYTHKALMENEHQNCGNYN